MSHALFDALLAHTGASTDVALAKLLGMGQSTISNSRAQLHKIGHVNIARIQEKTGMPVARIKKLMSDKSPRVTVARPKKPVDMPTKVQRLTVTKTAKWTSTVHRML